MMARVVKFVLALILIPFAASASKAIFEQVQRASTLSSPLGKFFLLGVAVYCAVHLLVFKPMFLYVCGHELAHVLACWLSFGRVTAFKVSARGGGVRTTKNNFFISLAPYYFPTYALLISLIYFVLSLFLSVSPYEKIFVFLLGAAFAFHLVLTAEFLKTGQPDFFKNGYFFSLVTIYLGNLLILAGVLSGLFEEISFAEFGRASLRAATDFYLTVYQGLFL